MWLALLALGRVHVNIAWGRVEDVVAGIAGFRQGAGERTVGVGMKTLWPVM